MNDPIVYPDLEAQGVETSPVISVLFDREMDYGNFDYNKILLIKKQTDISENSITNVPTLVSMEKIELESEAVTEIRDTGSEDLSGNLFRSKFIVTPSAPLDQNSDYSVVIPRGMSLRSVFAPVSSIDPQNSLMEAVGPFTGLGEDTYVIEIVEAGSQSNARYSWTRMSDGYQLSGLRARRRYVEIDKGLRLRFTTGDYVEGETFTVKVIPSQSIQKIYSWNFSTGNHNHTLPTSERSDSVINLPVFEQQEDTTQEVTESFFPVSCSPKAFASQVPIGSRSSVLVGSVSVSTLADSSAYNRTSAEIISGAEAGSETINLVDGLITVSIAPEETSNQTVVDLINSAFSDLEAATLLPDSMAVTSLKKRFSVGQEPIVIVIEFSENIDPESITKDTIKVLSEDLLDFTSEELYYSHEVSGKTLTIKIEE